MICWASPRFAFAFADVGAEGLWARDGVEAVVGAAEGVAGVDCRFRGAILADGEGGGR